MTTKCTNNSARNSITSLKPPEASLLRPHLVYILLFCVLNCYRSPPSNVRPRPLSESDTEEELSGSASCRRCDCFSRCNFSLYSRMRRCDAKPDAMSFHYLLATLAHQHHSFKSNTQTSHSNRLKRTFYLQTLQSTFKVCSDQLESATLDQMINTSFLSYFSSVYKVLAKKNNIKRSDIFSSAL